ncbi:hypothetical protein [Sorangium cellulosum]|uniref:hypothetical protein n=1 Tax=Sorangium cellulosum TaxID=56 RepID=UPI001331ABCA|nr:hypothetical protein [Sorangium cellulosum]
MVRLPRLAVELLDPGAPLLGGEPVLPRLELQVEPRLLALGLLGPGDLLRAAASLRGRRGRGRPGDLRLRGRARRGGAGAGRRVPGG